jgi:hypothetical protein
VSFLIFFALLNYDQIYISLKERYKASESHKTGDQEMTSNQTSLEPAGLFKGNLPGWNC